MTHQTIKPLEAFRQELEGCEIVAFLDISARTVLAWDGSLKWPQEHLDELCEIARRALTVGSKAETVEVPQRVMLACSFGCFVFLRAAPSANEALCCVFSPNAEVDHSFAAGRNLCAELLGAGQQLNACNAK